MYVLRYSRGNNGCDSSDTCLIVRENSIQHAFLLKTAKEQIENGRKTAFYGPFASEEAAEKYGIALSEIAHPRWNFHPGSNRSWAPRIARKRIEGHRIILIYSPRFGG